MATAKKNQTLNPYPAASGTGEPKGSAEGDVWDHVPPHLTLLNPPQPFLPALPVPRRRTREGACRGSPRRLGRPHPPRPVASGLAALPSTDRREPSPGDDPPGLLGPRRQASCDPLLLLIPTAGGPRFPGNRHSPPRGRGTGPPPAGGGGAEGGAGSPRRPAGRPHRLPLPTLTRGRVAVAARRGRGERL